MSEKYIIGQVLYLVSHKQNSLIPVQVQEITQKTTISGTDIAYLVMAPNDEGPYTLSDLDVDVYTNSSEVGKVLKNSANSSIDKMVANAVSTANKVFAQSEESLGGSIPKKRSVPPEIPKKKQVREDTKTQTQGVTGNAKIDTIPEPARIKSITMPDGERVNVG